MREEISANNEARNNQKKCAPLGQRGTNCYVNNATDFEKCTTNRIDGWGYHIACKEGLWEVCGPDKNEVRREAKHYFAKYKADGEYSVILGGKNVVKTLLENHT